MIEAKNFGDLINESFIAPLRSVMIVDDEYPTWEEVLNDRLATPEQNEALAHHSTGKAEKGNSRKLLDIISSFRSRDPGLIIDLHDPMAPGLTENVAALELASHLHQSDLLILDYNLEGEAGGLGGDKARQILKAVLSNNHFNLVVVHTGEDDLETVKEECLLSLHDACLSDLSSGILEKVDDFEKNQLDGFFDGTDEKSENFAEYFSVADYLKLRRLRQAGTSMRDACNADDGVFTKVKDWWRGIVDKEEDFNKTKFFFVCWVLKKFEEERKHCFSNEPFEGLTWSKSAEKTWLRCSKGFVAFVRKDSDDLLGYLVRALEDWCPTPSRLLASKMRHALNSTGVVVEDAVFKEAEVFARFYDDICKSPSENLSAAQIGSQQRLKIREHISLHTESMSYLIEDQLVDFGRKIVEIDQSTAGAFNKHYGVELASEGARKEANAKYNAYISNLPDKATSTQLDSGHVFEHNGTFWVCATPACDLQPGQTSIAFDGASNDLRPFTALRLEQIDLHYLDASHINSNSFCFIRHLNSGKAIALGLRKISSDPAKENLEKISPVVDPSSQKVTWRIFIAREGGVIVDGKLSLSSFSLSGDQIKPNDSKVTVHAKLRYEYALNFIQRVGGSVSRIGLGYVT
ncbi:hypothetical protein ATO2_12770 [Roseovarius sp. 22II1-1F6A]|nr:hypothetical protein ATO2_12770 [Roseovarius sp. 22II1-1F6A]